MCFWGSTDRTKSSCTSYKLWLRKPDGFKIQQMFTFGLQLGFSPVTRSAQELDITETVDGLRRIRLQRPCRSGTMKICNYHNSTAEVITLEHKNIKAPKEEFSKKPLEIILFKRGHLELPGHNWVQLGFEYRYGYLYERPPQQSKAKHNSTQLSTALPCHHTEEMKIFLIHPSSQNRHKLKSQKNKQLFWMGLRENKKEQTWR